MTAEADLCVVVPVYNEAENFPAFYESLKKHVRTPHRVVVVYDHEEDSTLPVARAYVERDGALLLLRNEGKGVLGALKTGLRYPKKGAVLVTMADLSDDHSRVDEMVRLYRAGCHLVSASRYSPGGAQVGGPRVKSWLSRAAGLSLYHFAGVATRDATNNFKLYSVEFLRSVEFESEGGFELALELTVKAHRGGFRIGEVPAVWRDRVAGKSNFKLVKWLPLYLHWYAEAVRARLWTR